MKHSKILTWIFATTLAMASVVLIIMLVFNNIDNREQFVSQEEFETFADNNRLNSRDPLKVIKGPLCSSGDSGYGSGCTLSSTYIYKLDGDFRSEGKEVFSYLKSRGFDFKPSSKYIKKTDDKLNDPSIEDSMTNTEPIVVDLYHDKRYARVTVKLGDRKRTMSLLDDPKIDSLNSDQLMLGLYFYSP